MNTVQKKSILQENIPFKKMRHVFFFFVINLFSGQLPTFPPKILTVMYEAPKGTSDDIIKKTNERGGQNFNAFAFAIEII